MSVASLALAVLVAALPVLGFVALLPRARRRHGRLTMLLGTLALGAVLYVPAALLERWLRAWTMEGARGATEGNVS